MNKLGYKKLSLYLMALLFIVGISSCQTNDVNLQKEFRTIVEAELVDEIPAVLVNVTSENWNFTGASGFSDIQKETIIKPDQAFRIASVTKTFVAVTVLRLWEEGKLKLDDPIGKYISKEHSEILTKDNYDVNAITIRHLLTHSSGMNEHTHSHKWTKEFMQKRHVWTRTEHIGDLVEYAEPVGGIGEKFSYSDTGYILLGELIETITGMSMGDAIAEYVNFEKLGLKNTYMEDPDGDYSGKRIHQYFQGTDTYDFHPSLDYFGGGGLLSTVEDLSKFFYSLFQYKVFKNKETIELMLSSVNYEKPQDLDYRMGIWKTTIGGFDAYTHSGFWGTQVVYIPSLKTAMAANYSSKWTVKGNAPVFENIVNILNSKN